VPWQSSISAIAIHAAAIPIRGAGVGSMSAAVVVGCGGQWRCESFCLLLWLHAAPVPSSSDKLRRERHCCSWWWPGLLLPDVRRSQPGSRKLMINAYVRQMTLCHLLTFFVRKPFAANDFSSIPCSNRNGASRELSCANDHGCGHKHNCL
jgi:hypothetical protein